MYIYKTFIMVNYSHALTTIVNESIYDDINECEEWDEFMSNL